MGLKSGYKQTVAGIIPEGWEAKTFAELLAYEQPGEYLVQSTDYSGHSGVPVLTAGKSFVLGYSDEREGICRSLPVVLFDDFTTASRYVDFPFKVKSSAVKLLRPRNDSSDLRFVFEKMQVTLFSVGGHKRHWISEYQHLPVAVPSLPEQRAIAAALSDVDALISALDKLIAKKCDIKQAAMQQLLTGKKRLPGFSGEWEVKKVKQFGEIVTGGTPPTTVKEFWNGNIPWVTPTDISEAKDIYSSEREITSLGLESIRGLPSNSVLVTCIASIGKNAVLRAEGACNQQINAIVPNKEHDADFLYYLIVSSKQYLLGNAGTTATSIVSKRVFSELQFSVPSKDEQQAIAAILSDMDAEIAALEQKRDKTRALKQGMMQELLTGKTRLL